MDKINIKNSFLIHLLPLLYPLIILFRLNSSHTKYLPELYAQAHIFNNIPNIEILIISLSVFILILNLYFFKLLLERFEIDNMQKNISLLLIGLTPVFITSFFYLNLISLSFLFFLLTIYFQDKKISYLTAFMSALVWPISSIFVLFYSKYTKKKYQLISGFLGLITIMLIIHKFPALSFFSSHSFSRFVAEFGNLQGYSLPILLISVVGFAINWFNNKKHFKIYIFFILVFFVSTYFKSLIFPLSFVISFWAARSIKFLYEKKWSLPTLKNMSLFIIFCLVLLSTSFFIKNLAAASPSLAEKEALTWMKENNHQGIVLSDIGNAKIIKYFSENTPFVDDNIFTDNNLAIAKTIFYSRDLVQVEELFSANNISYIYIDNKMKTGGIWTDRTQGLFFLLKNSEKFKNIYNSKEIEIWRYKQEQK